jgi:hypothetical protein
MEGSRGAHRILVVNLERRGTLGRLGCRCVDNNKIDIREAVLHIEWIGLAQGMDRCRAVVNGAIYLRFL